jgi:hypothetical protein
VVNTNDIVLVAMHVSAYDHDSLLCALLFHTNYRQNVLDPCSLRHTTLLRESYTKNPNSLRMYDVDPSTILVYNSQECCETTLPPSQCAGCSNEFSISEPANAFCPKCGRPNK